MNYRSSRWGNAQRYKQRWAKNRRFRFSRRNTETGVTMIEVLVVVVIAGILVTILAVGWLGLQATNTLNAAQDEVVQAIRQTQIQAIHTRQTWRVGFRELSNQIEWTAYTANSLPTTAIWQPLLPNVHIALQETTLSQANKIYFVEFNHKGYVTPPFGRLSLASNGGSRSRRCVFVSTLLGVLRKASDKQCY